MTPAQHASALVGKPGPAATLLQTLALLPDDNYCVDRGPDTYAPMQRSRLLAMSGLSLDQFHRGMRVLRAKRLVLTRMGYWQGTRQPHFALDYDTLAEFKRAKIATLDCQVATLDDVPATLDDLKIGPEWPDKQGKPQASRARISNKSNSKIENECKSYSGLSPAGSGTVDLKPVSEKTSKTVAEIFAATKASPKFKEELAKPLPLPSLWKQAYAEYTKSFCPALKIFEVKHLKQAANLCPPGTAHRVIEYVIANWAAFLMKAEKDDSAFPLPGKPQTGFLLKHIGCAVNLYLDGTKMQAAMAKPSPAPMQLTAQPAKPAPEADPEDDKPATLAEVLAIFGDG